MADAVLVVGGGTAAFVAAIRARQLGVGRVVMLEKAPAAEFGGNARYSPTVFRFVHAGADELRQFLVEVDARDFARMRFVPYSAADYLRDLHVATRGRVNPELAHILVEESNAAVHWMLDEGIRWHVGHTARQVDGQFVFDDPGYVLSPIGGGLATLHHWRELAGVLGVEIRYATAVTGLLGDSRRVVGVRVAAPHGDEEISAAHVVLCSGGFQASAEKRARYLGPNADLMKVLGSPHDTGEVLTAALELGAATAGQWSGADAASIDGTQPDPNNAHTAARRSYDAGVTVNIHALRFFDETLGESETRDTPWLVVRQPGAVAYQIVDAAGTAELSPDYRDGPAPIAASSLEALARELGLDAHRLTETVETFNASHQRRRLTQPPYTAFPVTAGITFTFGGLAVNRHAQVLNQLGEPIQGLYASGDIIGLYFHHHHLTASGQTRNVVFSSLAARHMAGSAVHSYR